MAQGTKYSKTTFRQMENRTAMQSQKTRHFEQEQVEVTIKQN